MNYVNRHSLYLKSLLGLAELLGVITFVLFIPSWSFNFWQAWSYLVTFAVSCILITLYFIKNDPKLIERRLHAGPTAEKEKNQRAIQAIASILFLSLYMIASLDHRFHWSNVSNRVVWFSQIILLLGFEIIFLSFKENSFASSIIELNENQRVISTGPYKIVRHPMYLGATLLILVSAPALGSWWAIIPGILLIVTIAIRLTAEEHFLMTNLPDYTSYQQKVRYRLIPGVW